MKYNSTNRNRTINSEICSNIIYLDQHRHRRSPLGKYAELHQTFLQNYHPSFYNRLVALGKLNDWLHTIDEIATRRFEIGKKVGYSQAEIENTLFTEVIYNLR